MPPTSSAPARRARRQAGGNASDEGHDRALPAVPYLDKLQPGGTILVHAAASGMALIL